MAREFYVEKLMGVRDGSGAGTAAEKAGRNVARHPYVLCHRDYHGQNIHIFNDTLYLIDYQDLRMGPDTYDLASLLRDRGVARILGDETELELRRRDYGCRASSAAGDGDRAPPLFRDAPAALDQDPRHVLQAADHPRPHALPRLHPADAGEHPPLHRRAARVRRARATVSDGLLARARAARELQSREESSWRNTRSRFFPATASAPRSRPRWSRSSNAPASTWSGRSTSSAPRRSRGSAIRCRRKCSTRSCATRSRSRDR